MKISFQILLDNPALLSKMDLRERVLTSVLEDHIRKALVPLSSDITTAEVLDNRRCILIHSLPDGTHRITFPFHAEELIKRMQVCLPVKVYTDAQEETIRRLTELEN